MQVVKYLLGFVVAIVVFIISAMVLDLIIPGEGLGRGVMVFVAVVRLVLAILIAVAVFRAIVKRRAKNDVISSGPPEQ